MNYRSSAQQAAALPGSAFALLTFLNTPAAASGSQQLAPRCPCSGTSDLQPPVRPSRSDAGSRPPVPAPTLHSETSLPTQRQLGTPNPRWPGVPDARLPRESRLARPPEYPFLDLPRSSRCMAPSESRCVAPSGPVHRRFCTNPLRQPHCRQSLPSRPLALLMSPITIPLERDSRRPDSRQAPTCQSHGTRIPLWLPPD